MQDKLLTTIIKDTGLEREKAKSIWVQFEGFFEAVTQCAEKVQGLEITDVGQKAEMQLARSTRIELKKIRVAADKTKKSLKEGILKEGRFINSTYKLIADATKPVEKDLLEKENYAKRKEEERIWKLVKDREGTLGPYGVDTQFIDLGKMSDGEFDWLLEKSRVAHDERIARELQEEEERIAREKAEAEERERIAADNERLRREVEERERQIAEEREREKAERRASEEAARKEKEELEREHQRKLAEERDRVEAERQAAEQQRREEMERIEEERRKEREEHDRIIREERAKAEALRLEAEERERVEREKRAAIERQERERLEDEARKERLERERVERELQAKRDAEERARREEEERLEAERQAAEEERLRIEQAGDKERLANYINALLDIDIVSVKSAAAEEILNSIRECLQRASEEIEKFV